MFNGSRALDWWMRRMRRVDCLKKRCIRRQLKPLKARKPVKAVVNRQSKAFIDQLVFIIILIMSILQQSPELIDSFAESVSIKKLDPEIRELLLSDLESKLLEIIQESKKTMRHSMRDFLRTDDVKHAMEKLSIPHVFGYPSSIPYTYERVPEQPNTWFIKQQTIALRDFATKPRLQTPLVATAYKVHFESLDGQQPRIAETVEEIGGRIVMAGQQVPPVNMVEQQPTMQIMQVQKQEQLTEHERRTQDSLQQHREALEKNQLQYDKKQGRNNTTASWQAAASVLGVPANTPAPPQQLKDFESYYNTFIQVFKNHELQVQLIDNREPTDVDVKMREILHQFENQPSLCPIFPNVVAFMGKENELLMKQSKPLLRLQMSILKVIKAIIYNAHFDISQLFQQIGAILFEQLRRDLPDETQPLDGDFLKIKAAAAHLLRMAIEKQMKEQPNLRFEVSKSLLNKIYKETLLQIPSGPQPDAPLQTVTVGPSGYALYGYIATLTQFGFDIIKPVVIDQLPRIISVLHKRQKQYQNNPRQHDAIQQAIQKLQEATLCLLTSLRKNEPANEGDFKAAMEQAKNCFGGAKFEQAFIGSMPQMMMGGFNPMGQQIPMGAQNIGMPNMQGAGMQQIGSQGMSQGMSQQSQGIANVVPNRPESAN
ncbi:hypothetical protein FGO68_gene12192 [Halteria grandinella]|uniref:TATA box binding protein associated factor (TAF) histone-like fold domain-containing protein n=1 Tax=Halteria grandinella TaxID=5974 RepID=A0A8J8P1J0_HALGN|nr:hypothetical protein FGO68_gene12192 [Halteria grandinella]